MLEILIKMADELDLKGFHTEASKVDMLIRKIAMELEQDYADGIRDYDSEEIVDFEEINYQENDSKDGGS